MTKFVAAPFILAGLPLLAQDAEVRNRFAGTWEAKWKDTVICTIRLKAANPVTGETEACSIRVDENGDLQAPESTGHSGQPAPILHAKLDGETLTFEDDDGDVFALRLVGNAKAELSFPNAPVRIKPIPFTRR